MTPNVSTDDKNGALVATALSMANDRVNRLKELRELLTYLKPGDPLPMAPNKIEKLLNLPAMSVFARVDAIIDIADHLLGPGVPYDLRRRVDHLNGRAYRYMCYLGGDDGNYWACGETASTDWGAVFKALLSIEIGKAMAVVDKLR